MTDDIDIMEEFAQDIDEFEPLFDEDDISNPDRTISYVQQFLSDAPNRCEGRGSGTAAGRGYDFQRLATVVLGDRLYPSFIDNGWYDTATLAKGDLLFTVESKSCINKHPNGQYGRYEIWKHNHDKLVKSGLGEYNTSPHVYMFVTYSVEENSLSQEIGKLIVPAPWVDMVIDTWHTVTYGSMEGKKRRQISWRQLLKKLGVSLETFREQTTVVVTDRPSPEG